MTATINSTRQGRKRGIVLDAIYRNGHLEIAPSGAVLFTAAMLRYAALNFTDEIAATWQRRLVALLWTEFFVIKPKTQPSDYAQRMEHIYALAIERASDANIGSESAE